MKCGKNSGRPFVLCLTGSLGVGKSTTAHFFAEAGVPVHNSDAVVHELYEGAAVPAIEQAFPGSTSDGKVDRAKLTSAIIGDSTALARLEAIIHPLVNAVTDRFLAKARASGAPVVLLDVPLLFETGMQYRCDAVVVVSAPLEVQRQRAFERPGMTHEKFAAIFSRQMADAEKRWRADFIVDSSKDFDDARAQVRAILQAIGNMRRRHR